MLLPARLRIPFIALCLISISGAGVAEEVEKETPEEGLFLFLTEEQQQAENEKRLSDESNDLQESSEPTPADATEAPVDQNSPNANPESELASEIQGVRYNGAVIKDGEVIDVWVNGQRFIGSDEDSFLVVDSGGVMTVATDQGRLVLNPGDVMPRQVASLFGFEPVADTAKNSLAGADQ